MQFRLLREDFIRPLREGIEQLVIAGIKILKFSNVNIFTSKIFSVPSWKSNYSSIVGQYGHPDKVHAQNILCIQHFTTSTHHYVIIFTLDNENRKGNFIQSIKVYKDVQIQFAKPSRNGRLRFYYDTFTYYL